MTSTELNASVSKAVDVATALRDLELRRATGKAFFHTELGLGEIDFAGGSLVAARLGELKGEAALMKLLSATEVRSSFDAKPVSADAPLVPGVEHVLSEHARRVEAWAQFCAQAPPLSTPLVLSERGQATLATPTLAHEQRALLSAADGHKTLKEILVDSGLDELEAMSLLISALRVGLLRVGISGGTLVGLRPTEDEAESTPATRKGLGVTQPLLPPPDPGTPPLAILLSQEKTAIGLGDAARRASSAVLGIGIEPAAPGASADDSWDRDLRTAVGDPARSSKLVGPYEVICRIGRGRAGSVYLARKNDPEAQELFALKLCRHLPSDQTTRKRLVEAAWLETGLRHPNVAGIVDAGIHAKRVYVVSEYVEGANLKQLLQAQPSEHPASFVVAALLDWLEGLNAVHAPSAIPRPGRSLVESAVCLENLMLSSDGIGRVSDFGTIARSTSPSAPEDYPKPGYLAPEQVLAGVGDARSDLFALGVVLYNALTGIRLFDAPTVRETLHLVLTAPIEPPSQVGAGPPAALDAVCLRALERDPERRFQSAREMAGEFALAAARLGPSPGRAELGEWVTRAIGGELPQRRRAIQVAYGRALSSRPPPSAPSASSRGHSSQPPALSSAPGIMKRARDAWPWLALYLVLLLVALWTLL